MAYRNIYITKQSHISVKNSNLFITQDNRKLQVPAEDILSLVVEDRSSTVTAYAMSYMAQNDIAIYFCDRLHLPNSIHLPFSSHVRKLRKSEDQWNFSLPNQKNIWRQIVCKKIHNQSLSLLFAGFEETSKRLLPIEKEVKSGDVSNREGYAAQLYFKALFGKGFTRALDIPLNAALNYGYAIVRGVIARSISAYGLNPEKGIHHKNEFNNFNLADDFIEPYRPVVDLYVKQFVLVSTEDRQFSSKEKSMLYDVINYQIELNGMKHSLATSIDKVIQSYSRCLENKSSELLELPDLIPLIRQGYE